MTIMSKLGPALDKAKENKKAAAADIAPISKPEVSFGMKEASVGLIRLAFQNRFDFATARVAKLTPGSEVGTLSEEEKRLLKTAQLILGNFAQPSSARHNSGLYFYDEAAQRRGDKIRGKDELFSMLDAIDDMTLEEDREHTVIPRQGEEKIRILRVRMPTGYTGVCNSIRLGDMLRVYREMQMLPREYINAKFVSQAGKFYLAAPDLAPFDVKGRDQTGEHGEASALNADDLYARYGYLSFRIKRNGEAEGGEPFIHGWCVGPDEEMAPLHGVSYVHVKLGEVHNTQRIDERVKGVPAPVGAQRRRW